MPSLADNQYSSSVLRPALWLWAGHSRGEGDLCVWLSSSPLTPQTLVLSSSCRRKSQSPSTFSTEPRSNEQLVWLCLLQIPLLREKFGVLADWWPSSQALSELRDHWVWLLSFVVLPLYLPHSPSEMGQRTSRSQNEQNLPKFKLMHKNLTPLWCN